MRRRIEEENQGQEYRIIRINEASTTFTPLLPHCIHGEVYVDVSSRDLEKVDESERYLQSSGSLLAWRGPIIGKNREMPGTDRAAKGPLKRC